MQQVAVDGLVLSADMRHAKRCISAVAETPGGSKRAMSTTVDYTLAPLEGERESAAKRRVDRHRAREERKLRSLDLSGAADEHRLLALVIAYVILWVCRPTAHVRLCRDECLSCNRV